MANIDLSQYYNQRNDGTTEITATQWNTMLRSIESAINAGAGSGASEGTTNFFVNGIKTTPVNGVVKLESKGSYTLSGSLNGRVQIGTDTETEPTGDGEYATQVYLDGVTIICDDDINTAIGYAPSYSKMVVTLCKNKKNLLICSHEAVKADSQNGVLNSENNMVVQGSGYLTIINKGGHGIKSSELRLSGNPHIYVESIHDAIHGNKILNIEGGVYYINGANDAFGTRAANPAEEKEAGTINIFGGEFFAYNLKPGGKLFDSKSGNGVILVRDGVLNTKVSPNVINQDITGVTIHTDVAFSDIYYGVKPVFYSEYFGSFNPSLAFTAYREEDGKYFVEDVDVILTGYVTKPIVLGASGASVTMTNACIDVEGDAITYTSSSSNVKIESTKETFNIIKATGVCIKSSNNAVVEPKGGGVLILQGGEMAIQASKVSVRDGGGSLLVKEGAVEGSEVLIGEEDGTKFGPLSGGIYMNKVIARKSSKGQKGNITVHATKFTGCFTADEMTMEGSSNLNRHKSVFYGKASGGAILGDTGKTIEPYAALSYADFLKLMLAEL